jgi:hypothetical protein
MAGEILVIMDIPESALLLMEETEIEGLVAGVRIVSVARGCKIESASYIIAAELHCDFRHQLRSASLFCCSRIGSISERGCFSEDPQGYILITTKKQSSDLEWRPESSDS